MFAHSRNAAKGQSVTKHSAKKYVKVEVLVLAFLCFVLDGVRRLLRDTDPRGSSCVFHRV